ncbi:MAG: flavodoxin-dependent (E)-4-hydroxy-3-methylbut-2-enyl-diphosphate synthase [Oscillospiraceae bacterium]|nr:flavodoxin-dependent (E)-4-hydroxy-3-methylbut-2-enyl-diphosphate synthase [Oscillospiraceae bacterium]
MTRTVKVGDLLIGGGAPVSIQSMLNVHNSDIEGNVQQAVRLEQAGCEIIRTAVPNMDAVALIPALKKAVKCPIVADIHFDYRLALASVDAGVDKVRINPGNIGSAERAREVVLACKHASVPIRVGVNSGSCEKDLLEKYGGPTAEALFESAMKHVRIIEDCEFYDTVISMKSSDVATMVKAYRLAAGSCDYPLHLGVTEAGTLESGTVKSAIGIGSLLLDGIGDTVRVSLTDDPVAEVHAAKQILSAAGVRQFGPVLVSCPTCGRTEIDLVSIAKKVEEGLKDCDLNIKVAVMGCVVNGPGEAREADIGIAGGKGEAILFRKGETVRKISGDIAQILLDEIYSMGRN